MYNMNVYWRALYMLYIVIPVTFTFPIIAVSDFYNQKLFLKRNLTLND